MVADSSRRSSAVRKLAVARSSRTSETTVTSQGAATITPADAYAAAPWRYVPRSATCWSRKPIPATALPPHQRAGSAHVLLVEVPVGRVHRLLAVEAADTLLAGPREARAQVGVG